MSSRTGTVRRYGRPPYRTVLVHGGPGAAGSLGPLARELAPSFGVIEPWQSARTVSGQVEELLGQITRWADPPVVLVGHSWGAWLALLFAAQHPTHVRGLVLVGSAPLRERYVGEIGRRRKEQLTPEQWNEFQRLERRLSDRDEAATVSTLRRFGELAAASASYSLLPRSGSEVRIDLATFRAIWSEAGELRRTGSLARTLRRVRVPVVVLHGREDPHPVRGVVEPLRAAGLRVRVVLLGRCGHEPWRERFAREAFLGAVRAEIARP